MSFDLPVPVLLAIMRLNERGYEAYAVGGCVRDMLRGVTPNDYDICVSSTPRETHAAFAEERVIDTGIQHGTVTVLLGGMALEITTFRADGEYLDGRHPASVRFTDRLTEDLKRRDFTVNAMAYHPITGLVDLFEGEKDLKKHIIRCVGDPEQRLTEDALRILRAVRFASQLNFDIEEPTAQAMHRLRDRLRLVSRERIAAELIRAAAESGAVPALGEFSDVVFAALPDFPPLAWINGLKALSRLPAGDAALRMAALLHDCGEPALQNTLDSLKQSRAFREEVLALCRHVRKPFAPGETAVMLAMLGETQLRRLLLLQQAVGVLDEKETAQRLARLKAAQLANLPLTLRDLPVNGKDLTAMGLQGEAVGDTLHQIHQMVLRSQLPCDRATIIAWLTRRRGGERAF